MQKSPGSAALTRISAWLREDNRLHGGQDLLGDLFGRPHLAASSIETLNGHPRGFARQEIVHIGCRFKMSQAGFQNILLGGGVTSRGFLVHQSLSFACRHAQVKNEVFPREAKDSVFKLFYPATELRAFLCRDASGLMSKIRTNAARHEVEFAFLPSRFDLRLGLQAVSRIKQSR